MWLRAAARAAPAGVPPAAMARVRLVSYAADPAPPLAAGGMQHLEWPSLQPVLEAWREWWSGVLEAAVPKKKPSLSRRRSRHTAQSHTKKFHNRHDIVPCTVCGHPKLFHHLCLNCTKKVVQDTKEFVKKSLASPASAK